LHVLGKCCTTGLYSQPYFILCIYFILRQGLTKLPRLPLNLGFSCLSLPSTPRITGMHHHTSSLLQFLWWQFDYLKFPFLFALCSILYSSRNMHPTHSVSYHLLFNGHQVDPCGSSQRLWGTLALDIPRCFI
jgi:hypothetical protein